MGRRQRMKQRRTKAAPAPEPVSPELVQKAEELGVPELAKPIPGVAGLPNPLALPVRVFASDVEQRINTPQRGDIVQVVVKPNDFLARIGIVHKVLKSGEILCYMPGRKGFPHQFKVDGESVVVVGKAQIKWSKEELPEPSVYSDEAAQLDKI